MNIVILNYTTKKQKMLYVLKNFYNLIIYFMFWRINTAGEVKNAVFSTTFDVCSKLTKKTTTKRLKFSHLYFLTKFLAKNRTIQIFTFPTKWCIIKSRVKSRSASAIYFPAQRVCFLRNINLMISRRNEKTCCAFFFVSFFEKMKKFSKNY